jgi:hypothetical protein
MSNNKSLIEINFVMEDITPTTFGQFFHIVTRKRGCIPILDKE